MTIDYDHASNLHTLGGPAATLSTIFSSNLPKSVLDVGCGTGTWMRAAIDLGVQTVRGIDGIAVPEDALQVEKSLVERHDLTKPFHLGRKFDLAICLEVAEHLPQSAAAGLVASIAEHTDTILFSAACPDQLGQHHINCQWPTYWQDFFNSHGFVCDDSVRWQIWTDARIEPWYRQNMFWVRRDPTNAGREPRIDPVVHPEMVESIYKGRLRSRPQARSPLWRRVARQLLDQTRRNAF